MTRTNIGDNYQKSAVTFTSLEKKEDKAITLLSFLRLVTFAGGLILIWIGFTVSIFTGTMASLLIVITFLFLLKLYSAHSDKKIFFSNLATINRNEYLSLMGDHSAFNQGTSYINLKHDFSYDIDLFGQSSLFQYLNRTVTDFGRDILAGWLSDPYLLTANFSQRQEAIRELSLKGEWRQKFMASGMKTPLNRNNIQELIKWMREEDTLNSVFPDKTIINTLATLTVFSFISLISGILPYPFFTFFFLANLFYIAIKLRVINRVHYSLTQKYNYLFSMNALLNSFRDEDFNSSIMNDIKSNISGKKISAAASVKKLGKLIQAFDSRNNMFAGILLNGLLLWDLQCILRFERWKSENKDRFPVWIDMIGQADAFISLGNYSFNNPDFVFPEKAESGNILSARNLGHQLINESKRVCNDFVSGAKGTICIISGANMAGKSTFLRTVAVNFILAMTGAPVCATEMRFIPQMLFTSMRTVDSLPDNESYFYAELRRLNLLKSRLNNGEEVLFILDEILKGTNSADKSTGSKLFIERMIDRRGSGLLATHDTSIGKMEAEYPGRIINKCFEIEIEGENISFDYKLREGITQKMNAVFLMKQMGILD